MNSSRADVFQTVRFFSNAFYLVDFDVPSLQQTDSLFVTWVSLRIRAFCFRMRFIFRNNFSVRFDADCIPCSVFALCRDPVFVAGMLVNPFFFEPFAGVGIVGRNEMNFLLVYSERMTESPHVASQKEIEWLDLFRVWFSSIQ